MNATDIDLLAQAISEQTPKMRRELCADLAFIQNVRNLRHPDFCDIPSSDLICAVGELKEYALRTMARQWDNGEHAKGLS